MLYWVNYIWLLKLLLITYFDLLGRSIQNILNYITYL